MRAPRLARASLGVLFLFAAVPGVVAAAAPRTFYDDFPFFASWVDLLPPYNEHLVTDVGALYLALALLFAWSARTLQATLVRATCAAWVLAGAIHLAFHADHLGGLTAVDAIAQTVSLTVALLLPLAAIWGVGGKAELTRHGDNRSGHEDHVRGSERAGEERR